LFPITAILKVCDWNSSEQVTIRMSSTVLVAVDGSKDSEAAFNYACDRAGDRDKILVVNGWQNYTGMEFAMVGPVRGLPMNHNEAKTNLEFSKKILNQYASKCNQKKKNCEFVSVDFIGGTSSLGDVISDIAKQRRASEVVVGNRGISFGTRLLMGSVSSRIANVCETNVVIVKNNPEPPKPMIPQRHEVAILH